MKLDQKTTESVNASMQERVKIDAEIVATCSQLAAFGVHLPTRLIQLCAARSQVEAAILGMIKKSAALAGVDLDDPSQGQWRANSEAGELTRVDNMPS